MDPRRWLLAISLFGISFFLVGADEDGEEWEYFLKNLVNSSYDHRIRPYTKMERGNRKPTEITVNTYLRFIPEISASKNQIRLQITFRQEWIDPRLAYRYLANGRKVPDQLALSKRESENLIWLPDTFFQNALDAQRHTVQVPNVLILVKPDGHVMYSERLTLTLACPMNFEHYPWGKQVCKLDFASYSFTENDIIYKWKQGSPVQQRAGLMGSLVEYELEKLDTTMCTSRTSTGTYGCLRLNLQFRKETSSDFLHTYIPTMMLVIVSWTSFFFHKSLLTLKAMIVMLAMLSMIIISVFLNQKLPVTSYCKAIDSWMGACFFFIFMGLIEVTLVALFEQRKTSATKEPQELQIVNENKEYSALVQPAEPEAIGMLNIGHRWKEDQAGTIDIISRLAFPFAYFLYMVAHFIAHARK